MSLDGLVIESLAGVLVWTGAARFPAMLAFYRDTLGLEPRSLRDGFVSFAWGSEDPAAPRLTITTHSEVRGAAREPLRIMLNLATADIEAAHAHLAARGVRFSRRPEVEHFGGRVATFSDPDGNTLQLLEQRPPPAS